LISWKELIQIHEINEQMVFSCRRPTKIIHHAHGVDVIITLNTYGSSLNDFTNTTIYISMIYNNNTVS
jgi:hypothetical protein